MGLSGPLPRASQTQIGGCFGSNPLSRSWPPALSAAARVGREARLRRALARAGRLCCRLRPWPSPARARGDSSKRRLVGFVTKLERCVELDAALAAVCARLEQQARAGCARASARARERRRCLSTRAAGEAPCSLAFVGERPAPSVARARAPAECRPLRAAWRRPAALRELWRPRVSARTIAEEAVPTPRARARCHSAAGAERRKGVRANVDVYSLTHLRPPRGARRPSRRAPDRAVAARRAPPPPRQRPRQQQPPRARAPWSASARA